jgi:hypothetical protein
MGQTRPVHAFVLITERTIEENLLATLSARRELAIAALDPDSDIDRVDLASGMDELKRRLEILLGARPEAPVDESERTARVEQTQNPDRRQQIAEAGGQLLAAAVRFLGELLPRAGETPIRDAGARRELSADCESGPWYVLGSRAACRRRIPQRRHVLSRTASYYERNTGFATSTFAVAPYCTTAPTIRSIPDERCASARPLSIPEQL